MIPNRRGGPSVPIVSEPLLKHTGAQPSVPVQDSKRKVRKDNRQLKFSSGPGVVCLCHERHQKNESKPNNFSQVNDHQGYEVAFARYPK